MPRKIKNFESGNRTALLFQVALLVYLVACLAAAFLFELEWWLFAAVDLIGAAACYVFLRSLKPHERRAAAALVLAFAAMSALAYAARLISSSPLDLFFAFPIIMALFLVFFVIFKLFILPNRTPCRVLGYDAGFAMVETSGGLGSSLPPGRYVVESARVARGATGLLRVSSSVFGTGKPLALELDEKG